MQSPSDRCPITNIPIINSPYRGLNRSTRYYELEYENNAYSIKLCKTLNKLLTSDYDNLSKEEISEKKKLKEYIPIFLGEHSKSDFKNLFNNSFHWNCNNCTNDGVDIKSFVDNIPINNYPQNNAEKKKAILDKIEAKQNHFGDSIKAIGEFEFWASSYLNNKEEYLFFLKQLQDEGYLSIEDKNIILNPVDKSPIKEFPKIHHDKQEVVKAPMNPKEFISHIRNLIAKNELPSAISQLRQLLSNSPMLDEAIQQSARLHDIRKQVRLGVVSHENANLDKNKIRSGLLELIREIEQKESEPIIHQELNHHLKISSFKTEVSPKPNKKNTYSFKSLATIIGVLGSIASIIGLILFFL